MAALLDIRQLHAFYGKSHVLHGVDLIVNRGEIVSLLGRNGVGRSTLLKAVMGLLYTTGAVIFKGQEICSLKTFQIAQAGIGYVPEERAVFPALTVEQNLILGKKSVRGARWTIDDMYQMFPSLKQRRHLRAGLLSGGEQQMLALCRTLMGDPDLILIDEPTEGLAPKIVDQVAQYLHILKNKGVAILLVEQKLAIALDISQRVYVIGHGAIVFEGTPDELRGSERVRKEWLEV